MIIYLFIISRIDCVMNEIDVIRSVFIRTHKFKKSIINVKSLILQY